MARKRPTASDDQPNLIAIDGGRTRSVGPLLTLAQTRALRRSERLTHVQLKAHLKGVHTAGPAVPD